MIKRKGRKFYVCVFNPRTEWKLLGAVIDLPDDKQAFCTHLKIPDKHFFIKGQGYPINKELLLMLHNAHIEHIVIPEDGKLRFKAYLAKTKDYLNGVEISEPLTERQRYIPLRSCMEIDIDRKKLVKAIYG